ncbi:Hypothetical protein W5S_3367 [Pectobacterium parmentieri]|uniref:Uncharacterized protein n=1 Tax=Pectobacterium parmentieri TaxID=1905730 RepID=A0A0H3I973_PECPM|nr:Hypothetical protein W5S_3367 [Pectobacterium parmentieri]
MCLGVVSSRTAFSYWRLGQLDINAMLAAIIVGFKGEKPHE